MVRVTNWAEFQQLATEVMSRWFEVELEEREPNGVPKKFDMVSKNGQIVGDAKYLTLVKGKKWPPAKMMEIAGHVWLLEKASAKKRFLVFGNQREVPALWLSKYGSLAQKVEFYFLDDTGQVEELN